MQSAFAVAVIIIIIMPCRTREMAKKREGDFFPPEGDGDIEGRPRLTSKMADLISLLLFFCTK